MSLIAKETNIGVPILYMPPKFPQHFNRNIDETQENEVEKILIQIHMNYTINKKNIKMRSCCEAQSQSIDQIFKYVDIYEVIESCKSKSFDMIFCYYDILNYAYIKTDVKLINLLLVKIAESGLFDVSMFIPALEDLCKKEIYVIIPTEYAEKLLYYYLYTQNIQNNRKLFDRNNKFIKYILACIKEVPFDIIVNIIFYDELDLFLHIYEKIKNYKLLYFAIRYESHNILDYLYSIENPIGSYINTEFLIDNNIDPNDVKAIDKIIADGNLELIKGCYKHITDLEYINNRIVLFLAVIKNDYAMTEFLLLQGVEADGISCNYAAYYGLIPILELLIQNGAEITSVTTYYGAYSGKVEVLKYLHRKKYKFKYDTINYLVKGGHININNLETLKDVVEPLQDHILNYVCINDNNNNNSTDLDTIEYLYNNNAKLDPRVLNSIARWGSLQTLRFLISKGITIDQHIIGNLATRGQLSIIRNLYRSIVPIISLTGKMGNVMVTRYFDTNRQNLIMIQSLKVLNMVVLRLNSLL